MHGPAAGAAYRAAPSALSSRARAGRRGGRRRDRPPARRQCNERGRTQGGARPGARPSSCKSCMLSLASRGSAGVPEPRLPPPDFGASDPLSARRAGADRKCAAPGEAGGGAPAPQGRCPGAAPWALGPDGQGRCNVVYCGAAAPCACLASLQGRAALGLNQFCSRRGAPQVLGEEAADAAKPPGAQSLDA